MQGRGDGAHRRFDAVIARLDAAHVGQRCDQANRAVATHAQVAAVVEEDHARRVGGVLWCAEQRAHHHVATARFQHGGGAPGVVLACQPLAPLGHGASAQVRKSANDKPGRLAAGMGVDHLDSSHGALVVVGQGS